MAKFFKNQIFIGVMIVLLSGAIGGLITYGVDIYIEVNYKLPQEHIDIRKSIEHNEFISNFQDSLMLDKKKVQDGFIYENRAMIKSYHKLDSAIMQDLKIIRRTQNILLNNNKKALEEFRRMNELYSVVK